MRRILLSLAGILFFSGLIMLTIALLVNRGESSSAAPTLQRALVTAEAVRLTGTLSVPIETATPDPAQAGLPTLTPSAIPTIDSTTGLLQTTAIVQAQTTQVVQTQITHVVQEGETLFRIAQQYGITVAAIQAANDQIAPESLRAGATLIIPLPVTATPNGLSTEPPTTPATELTTGGTAVLPTRVRTPLPTLTPSAIPTIDTTAGLTHTVQSGETLYRIAQQYGITVDELMQANNLTDPDVLGRGAVLLIPVTVTADPANQGIIATPATPTPIPWPEAINGIALDELLILPTETWDHVLEIARRGQALGRDSHAFSKLGDSTIENPHFLARFDGDDYNLGDYAFLQPAIDYFQGSFARESVAVQRGLNSFVVFDAMWAKDESCPPDVGPLACEIALHNPAVIFIRMGTNDREPESFEANLREIVQFTIDQGVIPLLGTKADLRSGTTDNNDIIRRVAADMRVPVWDFGLTAETLPNRGLTVDGVHLTTFYAHDYRESEALQRGYGVHNLLALMMLERIRPALVEVAPAGE